ncbi:MAG: OmpA family protein [Stagnimonas sp.]|nr:OmpA family protein [Stagnimonas sp.]
MQMKKLLVCGLAAGLALNPAYAQDEAPSAEASTTEAQPQHYLGVLGTFTRADDARDRNGADIDYGAGFSALYGWQSKDRWGFEVQGFAETFETSQTLRTDWYRYGINGDLTYAFGDRSELTPFVLAGIGGNHDDVFPGKDKFTWFGNLGAGVVTGPFTQFANLKLRGEVRYIYDDFESGYSDFRLGLGIEIPLFGKEAAAEPMPVVEEQVKVVEVPTGLLDSDGDGVVDEKDKCPDTPAGTRVDGDGCPLAKVIALNGVTFEFDSTRLRPDALTILDQASTILTKYPDMQVEVAGHTDSKGSESYNLKLSDGRAASVREYFVSKGIAEGQITSKGYGEAEPVADNTSDEGRERNRRVELRILN